MDDILLGILALLLGAAFCFRGYLAMRVVIPLWGAFMGFFLGAGFMATITGDGFLATTAAWLVGIAVGLLFGLLAYTYYEISVVLSMALLGYSLGATIAAAIGITWSWVILVSGLAVGFLLALVALVADLPMTILTVLTALAGSSTIVGGVMLLVGAVDLADAQPSAVATELSDSPWWFALYIGLAIAGMVVQLRDTDRRRAGLQAAWAADGGRSMRAA